MSQTTHPKAMKYYEIICRDQVIGVTSDLGVEHAFIEENKEAEFGLITKEDWERFGDDEWSEPISTQRFTGKFIFKLEPVNP